jgi:hypothetical protein
MLLHASHGRLVESWYCKSMLLHEATTTLIGSFNAEKLTAAKEDLLRRSLQGQSQSDPFRNASTFLTRCNSQAKRAKAF